MRRLCLLACLFLLAVPVRADEAEDAERLRIEAEERRVAEERRLAEELRAEARQNFLQAREEELKRVFGDQFSERLSASGLLSAAAADGLLKDAQIHEGPPPVISFKTADGTLVLDPAELDPERADRLYLLKDDADNGRELSIEGLAESVPGGLSQALAARVRERPLVVTSDLRDAPNAGVTAGRFAGTQDFLTGLRERLRLERPAPPPDQTWHTTRWANGRKEYVRNERRGNEVTTVVYARDTPYGTRFLGQEPGVERYSQRMGDEEVFIEYRDGAAAITHVDRDGKWVPLADAGLPPEFFRTRLQTEVEEGGRRRLFTYDFAADGTGRRSYESATIDGRGVWVALGGARSLEPPEGGALRIHRAGNYEALIRFEADGTAVVTHAGRQGTLHAADTAPADLPEFSRFVHSVRSADGVNDNLGYAFTRGEDGRLTGRAYVQQLRGQAAHTWITVDGAPLERPAGSVHHLVERGADKFLVRYDETDGTAEVLRAGRGQSIGTDFSTVQTASFEGSVRFDGQGRRPGGFTFAFTQGEDGYASAMTSQWVDIGQGMGAWRPTAEGRPLTEAELVVERREARAAVIAQMERDIAARRTSAEAQRDAGLASYNSNLSVGSRLRNVFQQGAPPPLTAAEVRRRSASGESVAAPTGGRADVVLSTREPGDEVAGRRLVLVTGSEADAEASQAALAQHQAIIQAWIAESPNAWVKAQRTLSAVSLMPSEAVVVLASGRQLQEQLDEQVNPSVALMPTIAAGTGISRNPGDSNRGANALARTGLFSRIIHNAANRRIYGSAYAGLGQATAGMNQARAETLSLVSDSVRLERLRAAQRIEEQLAGRGIGTVDILDAGNAQTGAGFAYRLADGSDYVLRLNLNENLLPAAESRPSTLPGTPAQRLAVSMDMRLRALQVSGAPLTQAAIDQAWNEELSSRYGLDGDAASTLRQSLHAHVTPARPRDTAAASGVGSLTAQGSQLRGYDGRGRPVYHDLNGGPPATLLSRGVGVNIVQVYRSGSQYMGRAADGRTLVWTGYYDERGKEVWALRP